MKGNKFAVSAQDVLLSFFPVIEAGLQNIMGQLDPEKFCFDNDSDDDLQEIQFDSLLLQDEYPRCIQGYSQTVDSFVDFGRRASQISVNFLFSLLPLENASKDLYDRVIKNKLMKRISEKENIILYDLFLFLFFSDCTAQILSSNPKIDKASVKKLIEIGNSLLTNHQFSVLNSDEINSDNSFLAEKKLRFLVIRQFSVIFSYLSIDFPLKLIENYEKLIEKCEFDNVKIECLTLHRFVRLSVTEKLPIKRISSFLMSLMNLKPTVKWAQAVSPLISQLNTDSFPELIKFFCDLSERLDPIVFLSTSLENNNKNSKTNTKGSAKSNNKGSNKSNNATTTTATNNNGSNNSSNNSNVNLICYDKIHHDYIKLYALLIMRDNGMNISHYQNFLDNVIINRVNMDLKTTLASLTGFLVYLRGNFVSKANLFWEWGKFNAMGHPGIEATHISIPQMDLKKSNSFSSIFLSKFCTKKTIDKIIKTPQIEHFPEVIGDILVNFAARDFEYFSKTILPTFIQNIGPEKAFLSINSCLSKLVDNDLRFSEWAQENPKNQKINIKKTIPLLFLQLKPTIFVLAESYNLESNLTQKGFNFKLFDSVAFPVLKLPVSQEEISTEMRERIEKKGTKVFDIQICPKISTELSSEERVFIKTLSFFPRIMNKSDFSTKTGDLLFNSMINNCPAVSLFAISVLNQLFNINPENRIHIYNVLMTKIITINVKEHLFVFLMFFIKLLDLSLTPKCEEKYLFNFVQRTEALCVCLMVINSNVIFDLANVLCERIYRFAKALKIKSNLFYLISKHSNEINQRISFFGTSFVCEVMNLMNLRAPVEFFEFVQEFIIPKLKNKKKKKNEFDENGDIYDSSNLDILLCHSVRYISKRQANNLQNCMAKHKFNDKTEFYNDYSIFEVIFSDEKSKNLIKNHFVSNYLISNPKKFKYIHWTAAILLLVDLGNQLQSEDDNNVLFKDLCEYIMIFKNIMNNADIKFSFYSEEKAIEAIILLIEIFIKSTENLINFNEKQQNMQLNEIIIDFCKIIVNFLNAYPVTFEAFADGPFVLPKVTKIFDKNNKLSRQSKSFNNDDKSDQGDEVLKYDENTYRKVMLKLYNFLNNAYSNLKNSNLLHNCNIINNVCQLNTDFCYNNISANIRLAISAICRSIPILKGSMIDKNIISILLQTEIEVPNTLFKALCANKILLSIYLFDIFKIPLFFDGIYRYFVGDLKQLTFNKKEKGREKNREDKNLETLDEKNIKFNEEIINNYSGKLLFIAIYFMMNNDYEMRTKGLNFLKRIVPLFFYILYIVKNNHNLSKKTDSSEEQSEQLKILERTMVRLKKLEPTFLSNLDSVSIPLIQRITQIITTTFPTLCDDFFDVSFECLSSSVTLKDSNHFIKNQFYFKNEVQSNVLQTLSIFLKKFSLKTASNKYTPLQLIEKLLLIYCNLETTSMSFFFSLFDQISDNSSESFDLLIELILSINCSNSFSDKSDECFDTISNKSISIDQINNNNNEKNSNSHNNENHITSIDNKGNEDNNGNEDNKESKESKDNKENKLEKYNSLYSGIVGVFSHFALNNSELIIKKLSNRLTYSYWFSETMQSKLENDQIIPSSHKTFLSYSPIVDSLNQIFQTHSFDSFKPHLPNLVCFCLINFRKIENISKLLIGILSGIECPEEIIFNFKTLIESGQKSSDCYHHDNSDGKNYYYSFITALCDFLSNNKSYGKQFVSDIGNECLRWCCGCGDLSIAARASHVFSSILRPFDSDILSSLLRSFSLIMKCLRTNKNSTDVSSLMNYLNGIFSIFNAAIDRYKLNKNFSDTFRSLFDICLPFLFLANNHCLNNKQNITLKENSKKDDRNENKDKKDSKEITSSDFSDENELISSALAVVSKYILYIGISDEEFIRILPCLASLSSSFQTKRKILDATFLSLFKQIEKANSKNVKSSNQKTLIISSFIVFLPWLFTSFAAFHNVEPYSSALGDDEIPIILQIGYLLGMSDQLPDELSNYLIAALKNPSDASVEDFILQAGIVLSQYAKEAVISAAPLLIQMANKCFLSEEINNNENSVDGENSVNKDNNENDGCENMENCYKVNYTFLAAILTVIRCFMEYPNFYEGVKIFEPIIKIIVDNNSQKILSPNGNSSFVFDNLNKLISNFLYLSSSKIGLENEKKHKKKKNGMINQKDNDEEEEEDEGEEDEGEEEEEENKNEKHEENGLKIINFSFVEKGWKEISEEICKILKKIDIVPIKYGETDLKSPIVAIPLSSSLFLWNIKCIKKTRIMMKDIVVSTFTKSKEQIIELTKLKSENKKMEIVIPENLVELMSLNH